MPSNVQEVKLGNLLFLFGFDVSSFYFLDEVSQLKVISILLKGKKNICMLDERQKKFYEHDSFQQMYIVPNLINRIRH